ncbi:hypothetical protein [Azospirillum sp.]|uniref:hypothetical protein n=1 Tax=Azospirillum sp. TaxID=34012 RepID=UPI003D72BE00
MSGGWDITDHACRICFGRILSRGDVFRCCNCGAECRGEVEGICGCGAGVPPPKKGKRRPKGKFRCAKNPHRSAADPNEISIVPTSTLEASHGR